MIWTSHKKEAIRKRATARHLIADKGYSQKDVSQAIGVSEKTISAWSKKYGWKNLSKPYRELSAKRVRALFFLLLGYSQKDSARAVGVSEKCMTQWVVKYNWKGLVSQADRHTNGMLNLFDGFLAYVQKHAPEIKEQAEAVLFNYLQHWKEGTQKDAGLIFAGISNSDK